MQEVQTLDAHREVFLLLGLLVDHPKVVRSIVAGLLHHRHRSGHLPLDRSWQGAGHQIRLVNTLLVIPPLLVPNVLIFKDRNDHRLLLVLEPQLAVRLHRRLDPVDHAQNPDGRAEIVPETVVKVGPVQLEGPVAGPQGLPVNVVELQLEDAGELRAGRVDVQGLVLHLVPVRYRQARHPVLDFLDELVLGEPRAFVHVGFKVQGLRGQVHVAGQRIELLLKQQPAADRRKRGDYVEAFFELEDRDDH